MRFATLCVLLLGSAVAACAEAADTGSGLRGTRSSERESGSGEGTHARDCPDSIAKDPDAAFVRSFLFPGWGQHYRGEHGKAWIAHLATLGAGTAIVLGQVRRAEAIDDYHEAKRAYDAAVEEGEIDRRYGDMKTSYADIGRAEQVRNLGVAALAVVWVLSALDAGRGRPAKVTAAGGVSRADAPDDPPLACVIRPELSGVRVGLRVAL